MKGGKRRSGVTFYGKEPENWEAGKKYKEMIREKYGLIDTDIPEIPSIEKIKEFRKTSTEL